MAQTGANEREPWTRLRAVVEPYGDRAVEADEIGVGQCVANGYARETQRLEEFERSCKRARRDGVLEKLTEHRRSAIFPGETCAGHSGRLRRAAPTAETHRTVTTFP